MKKIIFFEGRIIVDKKCVKCKTVLTKCKAFAGGGKFAAYKEPYTDLQNRATETEMHPYICSNCGYVEWYVENPEKFRIMSG